MTIPSLSHAKALFGSRGRSRLAQAGVLLLLALGISWAWMQVHLNQAHEREGLLRHQLHGLADRLEDALHRRLYLLDELESHVQANPDIDQQTFERVSLELFERQPGIRSLQLAKDSAISHLHPLTGNENYLGHDLARDPKRNALVLKAIERRGPVIAGPLTLWQGGVALIYRQPVFLHQRDGADRYWGLAVLLVDWEEVIQASGLADLAPGLQLALRKRSVDGKQWEAAFYGDQALFSEPAAQRIEVQLPNSSWELVMVDKAAGRLGMQDYSILIGLLAVLLAGGFLFSLGRKQSWFAPASLAGAFILVALAAYGLQAYQSQSQARIRLSEDSERLRTQIRERLQSDLSYLLLMARERVRGDLNLELFQQRVGRYVEDQPGLLNVTWVSREFVIEDVAPLAANRHILGLKIELDEPKRAAHLAHELRQPSYTRLFQAIQGGESFELWVPVYQGERFLGLFAAVYSVPRLLAALVDDEIAQRYAVSLEAPGSSLRDLQNGRALKADLTRMLKLEPPGHGISLRLTAYEAPLGLELVLLGLMVLGISVGSFWGLRVLQRTNQKLTSRYDELSRTQHALQREKELSQVTLSSIGDGVITLDCEMQITGLNRAAERLCQVKLDGALERPLTEVLSLLDESSGEPLDRLLLERLEVAMHTGEPQRVNGLLQGYRENGHVVHCTLSAIFDSVDRVQGSILVLHDVSGVLAMARELEHRAKHDALTGLLNRTEFEHRCKEAVRTAQEEGGLHALLYLDLDQFKVVNDTCGHVAGDELLKQLTALLQQQVRTGDILARLGGDEFGVLLQFCSRGDALRIADKLRRTIKEFRFVWEDKFFELGASIGMVILDEQTGSYAEALSTADMACYMAKDQGRNRVHEYQRNDEETSRRHVEMHWVSHINRALEEGRLRCYFQKIVPLESAEDEGVHFEVLVRMADESGALIPPGAFLPAAERYDLMPAIDRWMVGHMLEYFARHPHLVDSLRICAINLSGHSVCDEDFLHSLRCALKESRFPASKLCFEITETVAISNLAKASEFIRELKALGARFALDDFGSGMASFAYLKNLPVDYLKIDGSFVKDIDKGQIDRAMVKSINEIGHAMGIKTIAEFVESEAIRQVLKEIGVDYAQGYGVAIPAPLTELTECADEAPVTS